MLETSNTKNMTSRQYATLRMAIAAVLAAVVSYSVVARSYGLALAAVLVALLIVLTVKRQVTEVTHDERDLANAGRAARYAVLAYASFAAMASLPLFALRDTNPYFETAASVLAYSACALMILQGIFFDLVSGKLSGPRRLRTIVLVIIAAAVVAVAGARLFGGEDGYLCENGSWVAHGQPDYPPPTDGCPR